MIHQTIQHSHGMTYQQVDISDLRRGAPFYLANPLENAHRELPKWVGISESPDTPVWTCFPTWEIDNANLKPANYNVDDEIEFTRGSTRIWKVLRVSTYASGESYITAVNVRKDGSLGSTLMSFRTDRPNFSRQFKRASLVF